MSKYDIKRELKKFYAPKNRSWELVEVPSQQFIGMDGSGDPNTSQAFANAVEALYSVAYTIKFASKKTLDRDFVVGPLEGLWWADDPSVFVSREKGAWDWRLLISQPDWITVAMISDACAKAQAKKGLDTIAQVFHAELHEGMSAQALHIGSYDDEGPLLADLHDSYMTANNLTFNGPHHEIYLSDRRKTEPAKLKTILRQPVAVTT